MTNLYTRIFAVTLLAIVAAGCKPSAEQGGLQTGTWRATLDVQGQELPFHLDVEKNTTGKYIAYLRNAGERLLLDDITVNGDSVDIPLHVFDANIKARINGNKLTGEYIRNYEVDYRMPFTATLGETFLFEEENGDSPADFAGKYSVKFIRTRERDTIPAIGIINQFGDSVTATFLTRTGDYRYIGGNIAGNRIKMSAFDGNHVYVFHATKQDDGRLTGEFYSGKTRKDSWIAVRNDTVTLADPRTLTYLKPGYERIDFSFPDVNGKTISLTDKAYANKVVILQITGSWCPNCMDETRFLAPWYEKNRHRDVKIIGLAFEQKGDFSYASGRVKKMIDKFNVGYDMVIAGSNEKGKPAAALPMLNNVLAFPTTIFIGRDGKVKEIYTGFSGPGAGSYHEEYVQHFNETVNSLLDEKVIASAH